MTVAELRAQLIGVRDAAEVIIDYGEEYVRVRRDLDREVTTTQRLAPPTYTHVDEAFFMTTDDLDDRGRGDENIVVLTLGKSWAP
jgi:hypothetical protein